MQTLCVALGSALGACARWGVGLAQFGGYYPAVAPWGSLAANAAGSVLIGLYAASVAAGKNQRGPEARHLFVMAGFCGGFTTFSLFTAEVLQLLHASNAAGAATLLAVSTATWLAGAGIGYRCGQYLAVRGSNPR